MLSRVQHLVKHPVCSPASCPTSCGTSCVLCKVSHPFPHPILSSIQCLAQLLESCHAPSAASCVLCRSQHLLLRPVSFPASSVLSNLPNIQFLCHCAAFSLVSSPGPNPRNRILSHVVRPVRAPVRHPVNAQHFLHRPAFTPATRYIILRPPQHPVCSLAPHTHPVQCSAAYSPSCVLVLAIVQHCVSRPASCEGFVPHSASSPALSM